VPLLPSITSLPLGFAAKFMAVSRCLFSSGVDAMKSSKPLPQYILSMFIAARRSSRTAFSLSRACLSFSPSSSASHFGQGGSYTFVLPKSDILKERPLYAPCMGQSNTASGSVSGS